MRPEVRAGEDAAMNAILASLVLPPTGPLLLIALGLLMRRWWRGFGMTVAVLGLLTAWLLSSEGIVDPLARLYAQQASAAQTFKQLQPLQGRRDAVVLVLGAGVRNGLHPRGGHDLKPLTAERLRRGLWWSKQLRLPLAFTGGVPARAEPGTPSEASVVARALAESGQPPALWMDEQAVDTRGNAAFAAEEIKRRGTRTVVLVTHGLHMPRALAHFERELPGAEVLPAPVWRDDTGEARWSDFLPSAEGMGRGSYLAYEVLARLANH